MAKKVYLTRRETFAAAHRLFKAGLSDEENFKMFGKCSNPNWHGHNYTLEVTVIGEVDSETGFVMDIKKLKELMQEYVISKVDHKNLNIDVEDFRKVIPTAENIAIRIWNILTANIPDKYKIKVILYETERNFVEFPGED